MREWLPRVGMSQVEHRIRIIQSRGSVRHYIGGVKINTSLVIMRFSESVGFAPETQGSF